MGLITPPVGTVLFVGSAIGQADDRRGDAGDDAVLRARLFVVLMMVTYVPALSLWLPRALGL